MNTNDRDQMVSRIIMIALVIGITIMFTLIWTGHIQ